MTIFDRLNQSHADYSASEHQPAYPAQVVAAEEHERGRHVAKPVIVKAGEGYLQLAEPEIVDIAYRPDSGQQGLAVSIAAGLRGILSVDTMKARLHS